MEVTYHKTYLRYAGTKGTFEGWKSGLFVNFGSISRLLDPDPHSQYGSDPREPKSMRGFCGSETLISIHSKNSTKDIGLATFLQEKYST